MDEEAFCSLWDLADTREGSLRICAYIVDVSHVQRWCNVLTVDLNRDIHQSAFRS